MPLKYNICCSFVALVLAGAPGVQAQPAAGSSPVAPLPVPAVPEDAPASAYVVAARTAIAAGRTDEAMEAIERAESRVLVRSVRPSRIHASSDQALVLLLTRARAALRQGDRAGALERLAEAAGNPALDAPGE